MAEPVVALQRAVETQIVHQGPGTKRGHGIESRALFLDS